jgi:MHS family proline/betaine transporter-like MFS transporter
MERLSQVEASKKDQKRALFAGSAANVLEWYDFALYGYFAPVFAQLFFPMNDRLTAQISAFGVFAAGYLMRPLGAVIFGHVGDRLGRKNALMLSAILMAIPTTLIGALPTHDQVGVTAPALLTILRLIQGISVGGEFTGSISFIVEHAPQSRRGFFGSFTTFSLLGGILIGSGMGAIINSVLSHDDVVSWGWRIPFFFGILLGVVALYLRTQIDESPIFKDLEGKGKIYRRPVLEALTQNWKEILITIMATWGGSVTFYMIFVYMTTYLSSEINLPQSTALSINTISMVIMMSVVPLMGAISDRIGRKPVLATGSLLIAVSSYPMFLLILPGNTLFILGAQAVFALGLAMVFAPFGAMLVELFPSQVRMTAMSLGYNIGFSVFGGTAPLVSTYLIRETGNILAPSIYLGLSSLISLLVFLRIKETYRDALR